MTFAWIAVYIGELSKSHKNSSRPLVIDRRRRGKTINIISSDKRLHTNMRVAYSSAMPLLMGKVVRVVSDADD